MGASLLQRFNWVIDYSHERFTVTPNKYFRAPKINRTGLFLAYNEKRQIIVDYIKKGSPAEIAGIHKNDRILSLNRIPTRWFGINWVRKRMRSKTGKTTKYRFRIERNKDIKTINIYTY